MTLRATDKFKVWLLLLLVVLVLVIISVAEPPLIWAALAPGGQGPGANCGSDLLGSALGKKRQLQGAPAPFTKIFHFELFKSELLI